MRLSAFATSATSAPNETAERQNAITGFARNLLAGWTAARADRATRRVLAELDPTILKDIGIAPDEIHRIRAHEQFTPRAWRT